MKKEVQNYLFICMGAGIIILIIMFHSFDTMNSLLNKYNNLVQHINGAFHVSIDQENFIFFGVELNNIGFLVDLVLVMIFVLITLMIFLKIYWSMKDNRLTEQNIKKKQKYDQQQ